MSSATIARTDEDKKLARVTVRAATSQQSVRREGSRLSSTTTSTVSAVGRFSAERLNMLGSLERHAFWIGQTINSSQERKVATRAVATNTPDWRTGPEQNPSTETSSASGLSLFGETLIDGELPGAEEIEDA